MPAHVSNLFLLQDLEDAARTKRLADGDLNALSSVADWIQSFVALPHKDLGRTGPVCPFVPRAVERRTLWLAPEHVGDRSVRDVVELIKHYRRLLLQAHPIDGDEAAYKALMIVFTDLSTDRMKEIADDVQVQNFKKLMYDEDGIVSGEFHMRNDGSAIRNRSFQPFKSPVPFLLMRHAVVDDWVFFLDNADWLSAWSHRFGASAVQALAEQLRRTNWRQLDT
jgi:hypothetical protein